MRGGVAALVVAGAYYIHLSQRPPVVRATEVCFLKAGIESSHSDVPLAEERLREIDQCVRKKTRPERTPYQLAWDLCRTEAQQAIGIEFMNPPTARGRSLLVTCLRKQGFTHFPGTPIIGSKEAEPASVPCLDKLGLRPTPNRRTEPLGPKMRDKLRACEEEQSTLRNLTLISSAPVRHRNMLEDCATKVGVRKPGEALPARISEEGHRKLDVCLQSSLQSLAQ